VLRPEPCPSRRRVLIGGVGAAAFALIGGACAADADPPAGVRAGRAGRAPVPGPAGVVRTSWSTEAHSLGSYSYLAVGADPTMRNALATSVDDVVWFAGEATSAEHPATVHGARQSGASVAEAIHAVADGSQDVVVIGAGVAGARAAHDLHSAGHRVIVVEARSTAGGRTRAIRPEGWPVPVELGASWVHDTDASDLADRLGDLGVATATFTYDDVVLSSAGERTRADGLDATPADAVKASIEWADGRADDVSLADALEGSGEADGVDAVALDHFLRTELTTEYGADASEISARWGLAEGTEGNDLLVTGGYAALAEHELAGLDARYGWVVGSVVIRDGAAVVTSVDGQELRADRVVVTVPLGVLKAAAITFDPPLPADKQGAIDALGMGVLDKVWLRWDEPWWTEEAEQWTLVTASDEPYVEWFNLLPATGEPVLLGLIGGRLARTWAGRTDDEVVTASLRTLQAFADAGW